MSHRFRLSVVLLLAIAACLIGCTTPQEAPEFASDTEDQLSDNEAQTSTAKIESPDSALDVSIVMVEASADRRSTIPDRILKTAVVDGALHYVVLGPASTEVLGTGVSQERIIGLLREPRLGLVEGNIVGNPLFLELVFDAAAATLSDDMVQEMKRSETSTIALFDQRVPDINAPIRTLIPDIVGIYGLDGTTVYFEANYDFAFISQFGFMQLTPDIRAYLQQHVE